MTSRTKLLSGVLLAVACAIWIGFAPAALAQNPRTLAAKSIFDVNIRAAPGITSAVIGTLAAGEEAVAIGRSTENNWVQIQHQGTTGWAAAWLLVFPGDTFQLPVTTDVQPAPILTGSALSAISPYNLNVRSAPDLNAAIVTRLPFNTEATATGRSANSSWVRVRYNDVEGWLAAWLVILSNDINGLPVDSTVAVPLPPAVTPTPASGTPIPPSPTAPASPSGVVVTTPFRVNIRAVPSVSGPVLTVMPVNAQAAATGRNAGNNWLQVQYGETLGWVAKWVVVASSNTTGLPITSDIVEVQPLAPGATITGSSIYNIVIRSGPGTQFGDVGQIPAFTSVNLLARTADSAWVRVNYQGVEGWAAAWVMTASTDMNSLPPQQP